MTNRAYAVQTSHCCFFNSGEEIFWHQMKAGEASLETLAIHELVLPWRDGIRNPTHLPEKGSISGKLIQIWELRGGAQLSCFSFTFFKAKSSFYTMLFNIFSKAFIFPFQGIWLSITRQRDWHLKETVSQMEYLSNKVSPIWRATCFVRLLWSTKHLLNCFTLHVVTSDV